MILLKSCKVNVAFLLSYFNFTSLSHSISLSTDKIYSIRPKTVVSAFKSDPFMYIVLNLLTIDKIHTSFHFPLHI